MTDTSREAVVGLIAEATDALAALLDERDALLDKAIGDPEPRLEDLSDGDLPGMWSRSDFLGGDPDTRSYDARERDAERIRDLEAEVKQLTLENNRLRKSWHEDTDAAKSRAEHAEAERDKWQGVAHDYEMGYSGARGERDRLAATLQRVRDKVAGWEGYAYLTRDVLAILADTDEPKGDERG
jgi:hypothetical protein